MIASSPFLLELRKSLLEDFEPELRLSCQIAVLQAAGYRRSEIARRLAVAPATLRVAYGRVDRVAERLDHGED